MIFYDEYGYIDRDDDEDSVTGWIYPPLDGPTPLYVWLRKQNAPRPTPERLTERPEVPAVYLRAFTEEES